MVNTNTFGYTAVVPEGPRSSERRMTGSSLQSQFAPERDGTVLGVSPTIETIEHLSPDSTPLCRVIVSASQPALVSSASFSVDRELIRMLRPGDVVNITRTYHRGVGFSVLRDGELVVGVGAVTEVPLGSTVMADHAGDLVREAAKIFRTRDPEYQTAEWPLAITVNGITRIINRGIPTIGDYDIYIVRRYDGVSDAIASISRQGVCPDCAGSATASLMKREPMRLTGWDGERHLH
jgi:hypothetical protein